MQGFRVHGFHALSVVGGKVEEKVAKEQKTKILWVGRLRTESSHVRRACGIPCRVCDLETIKYLTLRSRCVRSRRSWALRRTATVLKWRSPDAFPQPDEKQTLTNQFRDAIQSKEKGADRVFGW